MASGMTAYVVDGETEVPVSRATAADVLNGASKVKVTACTQSHDASAEAAYAYVDGSTHRPVCPYCGVSLGGENQPHSFGDSGSCACGAVRGEDGQGVLITTLSGTYSGVTLTGTYLVTGQTTFTDRAEVAGSAKLILADGCTLTAWDGIRVAGGNTLEIEGQDGHTGRLVIQGDGGSHAPIGGNAEEASGNITIDGCCVEAGGGSAYGIGVSVNGTSGIVTIRNATVTTTVLPEGASITDSIIRMDGNATVYGNATLRSTLNVFDEKSLTVPEGASLTVPQNVSVNISGSLQGSGTIYLLSNDFNANTNNSTVRIWCLLELEDCTVSGEGVLIAHQGKYFCEAGKEITLTPSEGTQADSWKVSYSVTKEVGDEEWETVVTTNYYPGSFTMPAHPVSVKPHIHTFESGVCKGCGAVRAVYWDEKGKEQTITQCTILTEEMNRPTSGWYLVTGTLNLENGLYIVGDVKLILADGAQLIAKSGIWDGYGSDSTLTIYGQESGTGVLRAVSDSSYGAAIGVNNVVINGGNVYAENSDKGFSSSTVQVNRGNVEVTVGEDGYAFSGSLTASQSATIRINAGANLCDSVTGSFIFFKGSEGTVQGTVARSSVPMGANESLLVPAGSTLTLGNTTFTGPVCLKISTAPAFFASSLRQKVAATVLTEENAEVYYPLVYTDTNINISGLDDTNSFTRSDVTGYLVKAETKVTVSYNEPLGKLFLSFNVALDADSSFTMQKSESIQPSVQDAALAVKYGDSSYTNYAAADVQDAFRFAMEQNEATVVLFQNVSWSDTIDLNKGSITLTSSGETRSFDGTIKLNGGDLTINDVRIQTGVNVDSGKLDVIGGLIVSLTVNSANLSDVVISGGQFNRISVSDNRSIFFILAEGKALADINDPSEMKDMGQSQLESVQVVDHTHSWKYNDMTPDNHTQTCDDCSTKVTVPHKAAGADGKCGCGMYVVGYVNHRGEDMGTKGCWLVGGDTTTLNNSWYVWNSQTVSEGGMEIYGNVNLILSDGAVATWGRIWFHSGATLTIWGQEDGSGKLTVKSYIKTQDSASSFGTLTLNGGYVYAEYEHENMGCNVEANGGHLRVHGAGPHVIRGTFSTDSDGCALVESQHSFSNGADSIWSGIIAQYYNERIYTVYGNQTLSKPIEGAQSIHVPKGASLTCKEGFTSSANIANIFVDGTFSGSYPNTYYGLSHPSDANITASDDDRKEFNNYRGINATYYKAGAEITLGEGTWLLNNELVKDTFFTMPTQPSVLERGTVINYYDENGAAKTTYGKLFPTGNEPITLSDNGGAPAWFLLSESKTLDKRLEIEGSVNLVLQDDCTLTANSGVHVPAGATLTIYGQEKGTGKLTATAPKHSDPNYVINAAIGANDGEDCGTIIVNGGTVTASVSGSECYAAAIGGVSNFGSGTIIVNRGDVTTSVYGSNSTAAAIGGGSCGTPGSITLNGGKVTASVSGTSWGAAIGGGADNTGCVTITINGAEVTATVTADGEYVAAHNSAIGGNNCSVTINSSKNVTANVISRNSGSTEGAAIGGKNCPVAIHGGTVNATVTENGTGPAGGAAIGGSNNSSGNVRITGGTVNATVSATGNGAAGGAAIGGGYSGNCGYVVIIGDATKVNATVSAGAEASVFGAAIGGSYAGTGGTYIQLTKNVTASTDASESSTSIPANGIEYIKIDDNTGYFQVYGEVTLDGSFAIPQGANLLVPEGAKLTMGGAVNQGIIYVAGTLVGGDGSIYYQIKFADNTTGATVSSEEQNGVTTFLGSTYGRLDAKISLSGCDTWKRNDGRPLEGSTFQMPDYVLTIEGHNHTLTYSAITQSGHQEVCETSGCDYENPTAAHRFGEDRKCPCGCVQTSYVDLDGVTQTVAALPIPGDGQLKAANIEQGWYVLRGTIEETALHISGSVNLILEDGAVLTDRIVLRQSSSLTVWGQKNGTGKLALTMIEQESGTTPAEVPLTFNGGVVEVKRAWIAINIPVVVNGGSVTAEATASSADAYAIQGNVTVTGGSLTATSTNDYAIEGNVTVKGGSLTATSTNDTAIYGDVTVSGGSMKATGKSEGISGTATVTGGWAEANSISQIGEGSNGNGILITDGITTGARNFTGGLLQLGSASATVYGTPVFDRNLTTGEGEKLQSIHIPAGTSLTMAQGNTLTNNGRIYQDVGGALNTAPVAASTGKVYYQVKLGEGIAMQGNDTTELNASNYARGDVTFSGNTDGYFVTYTDYNGRSQTAYQSGSDYTVTQPITVSPHTHSFDGQGNCSCTVHVTVKVTMGQEETFYGSLGEALEAIGDQEATITLLDDTAGTITISKGNLTIQGEKRIEGILVTGGTVKLTGGEIGSLTVQGGTVKLSGGTFGTISSGSGVVTLLEEGFAFRMEDGSWLDGFNGTDTNTLGGGTVCPVPLKNALLTGPASITYGDSQALTFNVTVNTQSRSAAALSWTRDGQTLPDTGSSCSLSDWDVSRGADNAVQPYAVTCTASLDGYRLTARHTITINPKVLTISWSNTQFTYDGQSHNPTASSGVSGISLTLSQAQTNAGTHSAQVTGIQGTKAGNYQLPAAVTRSFTISPAAITGVTLKADSGVYTGEVQAPAAKEVKAGALTLNSGDYDLSVSPETVQNAGTYQVTITGKGNFTGSIQKSYTITKAASSAETAPIAKTLTYNGQAQALVTPGTAKGGTLVYSLDGSSYSDKVPTGTDAMAYIVWYKVQGDSNHLDTEAVELAVSMAQKDISKAIITLGAGLVFNGKEQTQTIASVTVDGLPVTYEVTGNTGTEKGTYTLTVTGTGDFTGTATAQFKIAAAAASVVNAPTAKTLTYNGQAQALITPGTAKGGTMVYSLDGRSFSGKVPTGTDAGTYTVWYKVQGDDNHSDTETWKLTVTVAPKDISKAVITLGNSLTYNGSEQTQTITSVIVDGLTVTYDVTGSTVTNAGSYTLTVTGTGSFTGKASATFTIAKAQPSVAPAELTITYGTKLSGCDLSGFAASFQGTKLPGSFAFDQPDVMPRVADSGTTAYRLTFTPDDGVNFHTASLEVSLTVNTRELTVDAAVQDKQYDGTNKASFISGRPALVGLVDGDVVELSHGEPYFKTVEAGTGIEIRFTDVFVISGKDSINYYLTQPAGITASIYISFKAECGKEYTVNADGWQNTDFVVTANEGYSLSGNNSTEGPWSDKLTVTQEGTGELSFYVRNNTTRAISKLVKEGYRIDKSMPTAAIRFDGVDETESSPRVCCKKQAVAVTITGSDAFSGVASISCFLADAEKTEAELKAITEWMEKTSFTIPAVDGTSCFLYAKVVDNAGNTAYYRANRILFDTSAPSISGVESGKVYYTTQTVTVSDPNLESVTLNGKLVDSPVTLKGNVDTAYELLATDKAGNETIMTVTMKSISSITEPLKELTEDNVTEDDRKQLEDADDKLKDLLDTVTDEDEKQKLQDELDKLEELLEILDKVKEVEELLDALPDSVTPDVDKDTEQDIKDARKEFEKLSEHQQSLVDESLKEKLERLEAELVDYQFETGADTVWNRGSGSNLQFVANGRLDKLEKVLLDGKELSNHDFTKSSPKTTIELQEAFLGTLEQGKHTLELVYSDGKAETGFTVMQGTSHLDLTDLPAFDGLTEVEVDGISYPIQDLDGKRHVMLPETGDLLTIYTYRNGSAENTHDNYPTGMRVFRISRSVNGATVTELPELADLLIYSGCSIRINGNRGIRMITSMTQSNKDALTGDGLAGFTMLESGTVVQWADSFTGSLNLDSGKHNYAYKRGTADPVFATSGGLTQYTNVLVGFNLDQCSKDIVMRPYVILEDADGKQYTLYGGRVTRSISYIAWQNRDTYQPGTEAYDYVHELMGNTTAG